MLTSMESPDEITALVKEWIEKLNIGELTHKDIATFFGRWVPMQCQNSISSEILEAAIKILEEFMFYENQNIDFLRRGKHSSFCENIISKNKFYYKCEECQAYEGRVLCVDCFNNSEHRYHKYKFAVAESIKFCNCGEEEAWKNQQQCTKHSTKEPNYALPLDVKDRICLVFEALLLLIGDFTTLGVEPGVEYYITVPDDSFCVVLYDSKSTSVNEKLRLLKFITHQRADEQMSTYLMSLIKKERMVFSDLPKATAEALKRKIESFGSAFVALVVPRNVTVVQSFIFKIIIWLEDILQRSRHFKQIFTDALTNPIFPDDSTMFEIICKRLSEKTTNEKLYKLLISGSLKEYTTKKSLAEFIVQNYDYLRTNTHNFRRPHIPSLLSNLTLHLFTVPSLSHHLISTRSSIYIILLEFVGRLKTNHYKFIYPERNFPLNYHSFEESLKILGDLEYLLLAIPTIWTEELREAFQKGMFDFLIVLKAMEGIDALKRKTGEHVEIEASWQEGLAMQKKIGDCASLLLKWCAADGETLMEIYKKTTQLLLNLDLNCDLNAVIVLKYSAECLSYDSETQAVSTYLPLTRMFTGLHVCLTNTNQTLFEPALSHEFTYIIDPVLRAFVMIAQSNVGLWRRNGNTVEFRTHFYGNVRYRTEMLDRDIQLLQIAACQTGKNQFMIHLIDKFGLIDWVNSNFEETAYPEEIPYMAEQFLELLIHLVSERCIPELSPDGITDQIKQEIIHALCIKPSMSHSELMEFIFLPGHYQNIDLDEIIDEVAVLKSNGSGQFELRKEFLDRYNPYFYHYTSTQCSKSNNFQRQRRKAAKELDCLLPPRLPQLHPYFISILNILQCGLMFHIMKTILERSINLQSSSYTEAQLGNILYLIGLALQEEESQNFTWFKFTTKARKWQLENYLEQLQSSTREDLPKDLIKWTIRKYKEVAGTASVTASKEIDFRESEKLRKSQLAAERRAKVLADLAAARIKFMECNIEEVIEEVNNETEESYTCILCQQTQTLQEAGNNVFVIACFVRYSAVLCADRQDAADKVNELILDSNRGPAYYASSCCHSMHIACFHEHVVPIWEEPLRNSGFDAAKLEFLCPLCQCLNNTVLPIMPPFRAWNDSVEVPESVTQIIQNFINSNVQAQPENSIMLIWKSLTYTLYTIENLLRNSNKPLLGPSSGRYKLFLESFVRTCAVLKRFELTTHQHDWCIKQLKLMLTGKLTMFGTFLNSDMLNILIVMTCSKTSLFEMDGLHNLHLIFLAQIVKMLFYAEFDEHVENRTIKADIHSPEKNFTFQSIVGMLNKRADLSEDFIWNYIRTASLPFLRCCVLFHSSLIGTPIPPALTELGGDTFSNLCSYLGLPQTRDDLLYNAPVEVFPIIRSWCESSVLIGLHTMNSPYNADPYHINQLLQLPNDYNRVIENVSSTNAFKPHICLVCTSPTCLENCVFLKNGTLIKTLEDHKQKCGVGIFLNVRKCKILYGTVSSKSLTYTSEAPYVDDYNETDKNLHHGNPLYLSSDRYEKLNTLWLSNGIEEEISRKQRQ